MEQTKFQEQLKERERKEQSRNKKTGKTGNETKQKVLLCSGKPPRKQKQKRDKTTSATSDAADDVDEKIEENEKTEEIIKIGFWNVAGLVNKDEDFWEYIEDFDIIGLTETWMEEKQWNLLKDKLLDKFTWKCQFATKEKNKGRASGGILTGVKNKIKEIETQKDIPDVQERKIEIQNKLWRIVTIYSKNMRKTREKIEETVGDMKVPRVIIGGDFNARTGQRGSFSSEERRENETRKSKDKVKNAEGERLIEMVEENGWEILNGNFEGDEEGEFTFIAGRGNSVIDYVLIDSSLKGEIKSFRIEDRIESDHLPLKVEIYGKTSKETQEEEQWKARRIWTEEGITHYQEEINKITFEQEGTNEMMNEMIRKINGAVFKKVMRIRKWKPGAKRWWDKECSEKKREARRALRRWKQGKDERETYIQKRRELKKLFGKKKDNLQEKEEREIEQLKNANDIWKYINRERKKRTEITKNISIKEWRKYFVELLEGEECKQQINNTSKRERSVEERETITVQEVHRQIKKLKKGKAAGEDELENEAWIYGEGKVLTGITKLINKVWRGEGLPERWKEGIISPIFKKGDRDNVKNYRGITLLNTAYKIYAMVLENRLNKELETKNIIPETQAGFRRGRSTG